MLHLLPAEYLREIRRNYLLRFGTVVFFLTSFVFVIGICSLLPTYLSLQAEIFAARLQEAPKNDLPKLSSEELEKFNSSLLQKIAFLENEKSSLLIEPLESILDSRSQGVSLNAFSITEGESKDKQLYVIEVSGVASSRSELSKFIEYLKADKTFSKVEAPLSLFAKDKNIPFTIFIYD